MDSHEIPLVDETVELLQTLIRNRCVNDGTAESGFETRNADTLRSFLGGSGLQFEQYEPTPGRASLVARIEGTDPTAPSLCLMGHTDVVPDTKRALVRVLYDDMQTNIGATPVMVCVQKLAVSVAQVYLGEREELDLPFPGLPLDMAASLNE